MGSDEMRKEKRKRKHAEVEQNGAEVAYSRKSRVVEPADAVTITDATIEPKKATKSGESRQEKSERRSKKTKKVRSQGLEDETAEAAKDGFATNGDFVSLTSGEAIRPTAAKKKKRKAASEPLIHGDSPDALVPKKKKKSSREKTTGDAEPQEDAVATPTSDTKQHRFILFIGNLPYTATTAQIQKHFIKLEPSSIRHRTDKASGRSKGFAFVEFEGAEKMNTCLKLYHHSVFETHDKKEGETGHGRGTGRKINVELTVGGGGAKSKDRKEKIIGKNQKLEEERDRRRIKEKEDGEKEAKKKAKLPATSANATVQEEKTDNMGDIHPSRRARLE